MVRLSTVVFSCCFAIAKSAETCSATATDCDTNSLLQVQVPKHIPKGMDSKSLLQRMKTIAVNLKGLNKIDDDTAAGLRAALEMARDVLDEALPAIQQEHDDAITEVNIAKNAVDECASAETAGQDFVDGLGDAVHASRQEHNACRSHESEMQEAETHQCTDFNNFVNELPDMHCGLDRSNHEAAVNTINEVSAYISSYQAMANEKMENCHTSRAILENQHSQCSISQTYFEQQYCAHRTACSNLLSCREHAENTYHLTCTSIGDAVEARKTEFRTVKQIECFLGAIEEAVDTEAPIGDAQMVRCADVADTDHLNIEFPPLDEVPGCDESMMHRSACGAAFFEAEYSPFVQRAAIEAACTSCVDDIQVGEVLVVHAKGNEVANNGVPDGANSIQFIDLGAGAFDQNGHMTSVSFYVARANQAGHRLQIYRPLHANHFELIAESPPIISPVADVVQREVFVTPIQFKAGDFYGWSHTDRGIVPFTGGQNDVRWRYGLENVGSHVNFNGQGGRVYAYQIEFTESPGSSHSTVDTSVAWNHPCEDTSADLDGIPICTVASNDGNPSPWVLFGDITSQINNFGAHEFANSATHSGLQRGDSVQVGTFSSGSIGTPGYSLDLGQFAHLTTGNFDLMIQYGDRQVFSHAEMGYRKTDGSFINNGHTTEGVVVGEHGLWGSRDDYPNGYYATFCAYNGGCGGGGNDFWAFSTHGLYPNSASSVVCGMYYGGWQNCESGDNGNRMRYYIRSTEFPVTMRR